MKKLMAALLVLLMAVASAAFGCRPETLARITAVDDAGRAIYIDQAPVRIVSLAPSTTEILFALGLGARVVGVTDNCDYPKEASYKPKVGGYFTTSLEAILARNPDLVLTDGYDPVWQRLEGADIPILVLQPKDIFGIFRDILVVGKAVNKEKEATRLVNDLQNRLNVIADRTARVISRPSVFFEIDGSNPAGPWTAGPGSFVDMLSLLQNSLKPVRDW